MSIAAILVRHLKLIYIPVILFFCAYTAHSKGSSSLRTNEIINIVEANHEAISSACTKIGKIISYKNFEILCVVGFIASDNTDTTSKKFDIAFARSRGGDVKIAMEIGKIIHSQDVPLVVSGYCLSSCANYIIPASGRILILKNSYIGFHGTPPRNLAEAENAIMKDMIKNGALDFFSENKQSLFDTENQLEGHRELIHSEVDYYLDIGVDELYATAYHQKLKQSRRKNLPSKCRVPHNIYHIMGPEHAEAYGLNVKKSWYPSSQKEFKRFIVDVPGYSYIFDMDQHPFYVQDEGFIQPEDCHYDRDSP